MRLTDSTLALPDQLNLHRSYVLTTNPLKPHALTYSAAWHAPPSKGKGHLSCSFGASQQKHTCLLFQVKKSNGILFSSEWKIWVTIYCNCQNSFFSHFLLFWYNKTCLWRMTFSPWWSRCFRGHEEEQKLKLFVDFNVDVLWAVPVVQGVPPGSVLIENLHWRPRRNQQGATLRHTVICQIDRQKFTCATNINFNWNL